MNEENGFAAIQFGKKSVKGRIGDAFSEDRGAGCDTYHAEFVEGASHLINRRMDMRKGRAGESCEPFRLPQLVAEWQLETAFLVTVAGPRWNYTSFPIQPVRAPENIRELTQRAEPVKHGSRRRSRRALQPTRPWRQPGAARAGRRNRLRRANPKNHLSMYR